MKRGSGLQVQRLEQGAGGRFPVIDLFGAGVGPLRAGQKRRGSDRVRRGGKVRRCRGTSSEQRPDGPLLGGRFGPVRRRLRCAATGTSGSQRPAPDPIGSRPASDC